MALTTGETATTHCGGFVGYTSFGSFTLTNNIYTPAAAAGNEKAVRSEMTFYHFNPNHTGTLTTANSYYTKTMGDAQGKELHSITISTGITIVPTGNATSFSASGITTYEGNQCLKYNDVFYAGCGDEVQMKLIHSYEGTVNFNVSEGYGTLVSNDDIYTLTMPDANVTINISGNSDDGINGLGEEGAPYVISKEADWNILASYVNSGKEGYASAYYELGADNITVTTMMGNNTHRFKGHFDGNGKTLSFNYDTN